MLSLNDGSSQLNSKQMFWYAVRCPVSGRYQFPAKKIGVGFFFREL